MSYILDALKRAESERSRGAVPNIHAQPELAGDGDARGPIARQGVALGVAAAVLLAAAAAWWGMSADVAPPTAVVADSMPSTAPSGRPVAPPATTASMPTPALAARLPATPVVPLRMAPAKPLASPWLAQKAAPLPASSPARQPPAAVAPSAALARADTAEPAMTEPTPATGAATASERIYTLKELPANIRSSLPVLTVGGATYSENAASRMLIVNGNLFHEGDKLTPELTLQQIKLRAAVLSFRGYRYSIGY